MFRDFFQAVSFPWSCISTVLLIQPAPKSGMISPFTASLEGLIMRSALAVSLVAGVLLLWLVLLPRWWWRGGKTAPATPHPTRRKRDPKPFAGDTLKPAGELCEQGVDAPPQMPGAPPPRRIFPRGRHRQVETTGPFGPQAACSYPGGVGGGTIRANGPPNGRRWRQLVCRGCRGAFLETHGTPFPAKQVAPAKLVWAIAALAAGRGIRAVTRVFEVAPHAGLARLVEAAAHLEALARYHRRDLHVEQGQRDERFA